MDNLPEKAAGVLSQFATTSTSIDVFSDSVIESVKQGEVDPLAVYTQIKAMAKASERILKEISENVLTAADKYPGTKFSYMGNDVVKGSVKTTYDYSVCSDPEWEQFKTDEETAKASREARETFLKSLTKPTDLIIDGVGVTVNPPKKNEVQGIKLTIK
jgi:hypothetical protein